MGWLVTPDAVLVIDSQFADTAQMFLDGLKKRTPRKIDLLINSHHHPDHTGGNKVLQPMVTKIVAHENAPVSNGSRPVRTRPKTPRCTPTRRSRTVGRQTSATRSCRPNKDYGWVTRAATP